MMCLQSLNFWNIDAGQVQVYPPSSLFTLYLFPLLPMNSHSLLGGVSTLGSSGFGSTKMSLIWVSIGTSIHLGQINFFPLASIRVKDPAPLVVWLLFSVIMCAKYTNKKKAGDQPGSHIHTKHTILFISGSSHRSQTGDDDGSSDHCLNCIWNGKPHEV